MSFYTYEYVLTCKCLVPEKPEEGNPLALRLEAVTSLVDPAQAAGAISHQAVSITGGS